MLVIISGPSGVGKDTIIDALRRRARRRADGHAPLRRDVHDAAPRPGEVDGVDYHFLDAATSSSALRDAGGLLEATEVHGNWYGTPRDQVRRALAAGQDVDPQDRRPGRADGQGAGRRRRCSSSSSRRRSRTLFERLRARATETAERARAAPAQRRDRARPPGRLRLRRRQRDRPGRADRRRRSTRSSRAEHAAHPDRRVRV